MRNLAPSVAAPRRSSRAQFTPHEADRHSGQLRGLAGGLAINSFDVSADLLDIEIKLGLVGHGIDISRCHHESKLIVSVLV
jgi:hypothetical protein